MSGYGPRVWQSGEECVCGCGVRAMQLHHVVYAQELRRPPNGSPACAMEPAPLLRDTRNLVPVALRCHQRHHTGFGVLPLTVLPDSVFEFAGEVLGSGPAYEYLRRRYGGSDPRLDGLLADWELSA